MGTRRQTLTDQPSDAPVWEPARRTEVCIPDLPDTIRAQGQRLDGETAELFGRVLPVPFGGVSRRRSAGFPVPFGRGSVPLD